MGEVARDFFERYGSELSTSASAEAAVTLYGFAHQEMTETPGFRIAGHGGSVVLDLGDSSGRCVVIGSGGWRLQKRSPVPFLRNGLTGTMPVPVSGTSPEQLLGLAKFMNVREEHLWLIIGWCVAAFIPETQRPILVLRGEPASGKSYAMRILGQLVDPGASGAALPRAENYPSFCARRHVPLIDNLSKIDSNQSDAMCRGVTGCHHVIALRRGDSYEYVDATRSPIVTTLNLPVVRSDLADRLLCVDMPIIPPHGRLSRSDLDARFAEQWPAFAGAMLELVAKVMQALPTLHLPTARRFPDFEKILHALDVIMGKSGSLALAAYMQERAYQATDAIESNTFVIALVEFLRGRQTAWEGTCTELLDAIKKPAKCGDRWPVSAAAVGRRLREVAPALREMGFVINTFRRPGTARTRVWRLSRPVTDDATQGGGAAPSSGD